MPRTEHEIFEDLATLCVSPGYIHAVAYFCFRDNLLKFGDELEVEDFQNWYSDNRLTRTEVSTLIGLMTKNAVYFDFPPPDMHAEHISKSEELLKELHESISAMGITQSDWLEAAQVGKNPLSSGAALREPIFYGGDSAYSFQYRDLAIKRYTKDETWLRSNLEISIDSACRVAAAISSHQSKRAIQYTLSLKDKPISDWTMLPCFEFSVKELTAICDVDASEIQRVLERFSLSQDELNSGFDRWYPRQSNTRWHIDEIQHYNRWQSNQ